MGNKERKQRQHQKMIAEGWIRYEKKIRPAWKKYLDALIDNVPTDQSVAVKWLARLAKLMKTGE